MLLITPEQLRQFEVSLTPDAIKNREMVMAECARRRGIGLTGETQLSDPLQVQDYLQRVREIDPTLDSYINQLIGDTRWSVTPELIVCMPVVGTGGQEEVEIQNTLQNLANDESAQRGKMGIVLFVNRPEGLPRDATADNANEMMQRFSLNGIILDGEIPQSVGSVDGVFAEEMATQPNQVPIALIRDIINISAMKVTGNTDMTTGELPLLMQLDGDFEGFKTGDFAEIIRAFQQDRVMQYMQCTSDWDSIENPTASIEALRIGAELMRELPRILKEALNSPTVPLAARQQIIFGEAIQRGIQVPQVERMASVARKGGYGLSRMRHDELDVNMRLSAAQAIEGVRSRSDIICVWNNRRAVQSWAQYQQPPISQWVKPFSVIDDVRSSHEQFTVSPNGIATAINRTLARFPVPRRLAGVYDDIVPVVQRIVAQVVPDIQYYPSVVTTDERGLVIMQYQFL